MLEIANAAAGIPFAPQLSGVHIFSLSSGLEGGPFMKTISTLIAFIALQFILTTGTSQASDTPQGGYIEADLIFNWPDKSTAKTTETNLGTCSDEEKLLILDGMKSDECKAYLKNAKPGKCVRFDNVEKCDENVPIPPEGELISCGACPEEEEDTL